MRILDLFCGAGIGADGMKKIHSDAEIIGVDKHEQPYYPYTFIQANAIDYPLEGFDFIWCSPPCQAYSTTRSLARKDHLKLVDVMRYRLKSSGIHYCIEMVTGEPLIGSVVLCGAMFGLGTYRHRYFETSFPVERLSHPRHDKPNAKLGQAPRDGEMAQVVGHFRGTSIALKAMGVDRFVPQKYLSQGVPPAYSSYICCFIPPARSPIQPSRKSQNLNCSKN